MTTSSPVDCVPDAIESKTRCYAARLRQIVERFESFFGPDDEATKHSKPLLDITAPAKFLEKLLVPAFLLSLIQVIQVISIRRDMKDEYDLMTAAVSIGISKGMRITRGVAATKTARLKWAWQLIRLDLGQSVSIQRHPELSVYVIWYIPIEIMTLLKSFPTSEPEQFKRNKPNSTKRLYQIPRILERMGRQWRRSEALDFRSVLLSWVSYQLQSIDISQYNLPMPKSFDHSFKDGKIYIALLSAIIPDAEIDLDGLLSSSTTPEQRAQFIVAQAGELGLKDFIVESDIVHGVDRVNVLFISELLRILPSLDSFTILITRGIQNDYCGPLPSHSTSPAHIGMQEALRLCSREKSVPGPLESLVLWSRKLPKESFAVIHIRDWHDPHDPSQVSHLVKFGSHCLIGSEGAKLIGGLLEQETDLNTNEYLVNVTGVNDVHETSLRHILDTLKKQALGRLIRIGIVGVCTDFQISNLVYELQTRLGISHLATCSALTGTKTRRLHFETLDNLERQFDISVFHSPADFMFWLCPEGTGTDVNVNSSASTSAATTPTKPQSGPPREEGMEAIDLRTTPPIGIANSLSPTDGNSSGNSNTSGTHSQSPTNHLSPSNHHSPHPMITKSSLGVDGHLTIRGLAGGSFGNARESSSQSRRALFLSKFEYDQASSLLDEDVVILGALFRNSSQVTIISKLSGGFSGALVFLAKSFDDVGHQQGPFVIKLGNIDIMTKERNNFERVEEIIGNQAPYIFSFYESVRRAGIKFAFASHCGDVASTSTFKKLMDLLLDNSSALYEMASSPKDGSSPSNNEAAGISANGHLHSSRGSLALVPSFLSLTFGRQRLANFSAIVSNDLASSNCTKAQIEDFALATLSQISTILNRFYIAAKPSTGFEFLDSYDFNGRGWSLAAGGTDDPESLAARIRYIAPDCCSDPKIDWHCTFSASPMASNVVVAKYFNVWQLMNNLEPLRNWCKSQPSFLVSLVHGDLHYNNVLIDASENVWLIDFQYTHYSHYLKDLTKMEHECYATLTSEEEFSEALQVTEFFHSHPDPFGTKFDEKFDQDLDKLMMKLSQSLQFTVKACLHIRNMIRSANAGRENDILPYHITMLRYALHTLCATWYSIWNRKWALVWACSHAQIIVETLSQKSLWLATTSNLTD